MNASFNLVAGVFFGADLEGGTFHSSLPESLTVPSVDDVPASDVSASEELSHQPANQPASADNSYQLSPEKDGIRYYLFH